MKRVLILDTETTGVDPARDGVLEVAVAVWSVEHLSMLAGHSWLVDAAEVPNGAAHLNGIADELRVEGERWAFVEREIAALQLRCDAVLAHNAEFDKQWFGPSIRAAIPWICTRSDISWPRAGARTSLVDIALAHGVGVSHAHRAISDVLTLLRLLERAAEFTEIGAMLRRGLRVESRYRADASYAQRDLARAAGFRWDPSASGWFRWMADDDVGALPFAVVRAVEGEARR